MASTLAVDKIKTLSGVAIGWPAADGDANTILGTEHKDAILAIKAKYPKE